MKERVDLTYLTAMMNGDEKLAKKFLEIFRNQAPLQMLALRSQIENKDWEAVSLTSHSLKSQFNYLQLTSLAGQMTRMEHLTDENNTEGMEELLIEIEKQMSSLFEKGAGV